MAVLNKTWGSVTEMPTATTAGVVTGEDEAGEGAEASEATIMAKPMMIYVPDGAAAGGFDKVEKVVLMDDKVCIGMWAFNCVKMTPDDAAKDELLADTGDDVPRFVFVSRDMKNVDTVGEKKMSAKNVFKTMKKHAKKAYTTKFEKNVKSTLKLLGELDKIANETKLLASKEARETDPSAADKKKFQKLREELEERTKAAQEEREKLLTFEAKAIKTA